MIGRSCFAKRTLLLLVQIGFVLVTTTGSHAQESWDAIYLGGAKIGFIHTFVEKVQDRGRDFLRVRIEIQQNLKRGNDVAVTKLIVRNDRDVVRPGTQARHPDEHRSRQPRASSARQRNPRQDEC